jgi:hypothetical protein
VYSILLIPAPPSGNLIALAHHSALLAFPHSWLTSLSHGFHENRVRL